MPKPTHFILGKKKYRYLPDSKTQYYGYCSDPVAKKRFIAIGRKCRGNPQLELDTLIHEMLHALGPFKREDWGKDWVEEWTNNAAYDIAAALWQLGYRKTDNGENEKEPEETHQ